MKNYFKQATDTTTQTPELIPVSEWNKYFPYPSVGALRQMIHKVHLKQCTVNFKKKNKGKKTHLFVAYNEEYSQAELIETCNLPVNQRLKINISLLRRLQTGAEIETAIYETRELYKIPYKETCLQYIYDADIC